MTKEEFKKLANDYLRAELWEELTDSDVFGVELDIMCQALKACIGLRKLIDEKDGDVVSLGFDEYLIGPSPDFLKTIKC